MTVTNMADQYRNYIDCLNRRDWDGLRSVVAENVSYNDKTIGFAGYRDMLIGNYRDIPDLKYEVDMLLVDGAHVASRLWFNCTPTGSFMGLAVNGRHVTFSENVFYRFDDGRIDAVWSVVDKAAIEAQLHP